MLAATNGFAAADCSALVASQGCACAAPITPGTPIGQLTGVEGNVQKSGAHGYTPVTVSTPLNVGDGLLIGDTGKATMVVGLACQQALGSETSVFVRAIQGCACVDTIAHNDVAPVLSNPRQIAGAPSSPPQIVGAANLTANGGPYIGGSFGPPAAFVPGSTVGNAFFTAAVVGGGAATAVLLLAHKPAQPISP
jgi:hypothetical protein